MQPLWKTVWRVLKKLKIELSYDLTTPLLGINPKKTKTCVFKNMYWKRYMHPNVSSIIIYNYQDMETTYVSSRDEWIKKMWYI